VIFGNLVEGKWRVRAQRGGQRATSARWAAWWEPCSYVWAQLCQRVDSSPARSDLVRRL